MAIAGNGAAPGLPVNSGCGCTGPIVTALYAVPSDNPPATSNPGGSGFQYGKTPPANIGPVAPYIPPVIAGPTSLGGGGGAQYFNAAKPLPGSTRGVY